MKKRVCWLALAVMMALAAEGLGAGLDEKIPVGITSSVIVNELPVSLDITERVLPSGVGASIGSYVYGASGWTEASTATKIDVEGNATIAAADLTTLSRDVPVKFRFLLDANIMEIAAKIKEQNPKFDYSNSGLLKLLKDGLADTLYNAVIPQAISDMDTPKTRDYLPGLVTIAKQVAAEEYAEVDSIPSRLRSLQFMVNRLDSRIASAYDASAYSIAYRIKRIRGLLMQSNEDREQFLATLSDSGFLKSLVVDYDKAITAANNELEAATKEVADDESKSEEEKTAAYAELWEKYHDAEEKAFDDLVTAIDALSVEDRDSLRTEVSDVISDNNISSKFPSVSTSAFLPITTNMLYAQLTVLDEASISDLLSLEAVVPVLYDGAMSLWGESITSRATHFDKVLQKMIGCGVVPAGTTWGSMRNAVAGLADVPEDAIRKIETYDLGNGTDYDSYAEEIEVLLALKREVDAVKEVASAKRSAADVTVSYYMAEPDEPVTPSEPKSPSSEKDKESNNSDNPSSDKGTDSDSKTNQGSSIQPQPVEITPEKEEQVHSALKENIANLDLPSGVNPSTVDVFTFTEDTVKMGEKRNTSSLKESEKVAVSDDNKVPVAVLPEMSFDVTGIYCFETSLDIAVPEGATLEWHPFPQTKANDGSVASVAARLAADGAGDKTAVFMKNGKTITTVPADHEVEVAAYFEKGITYAPVIAAVTNSGSPTSDKNGGGCDAGFAGGGALALGALLIAFKRFHS